MLLRLRNRVLRGVFLLLVIKLMPSSGLICNICNTRNYQGECADQTRLCGVDQGVCSYLIETSGSISRITRSCEQEQSCHTNSNQQPNCNNRFCKFCCQGDNCNLNGPTSCNCEMGACDNPNPFLAPILFCQRRRRKNMCFSDRTWSDLTTSAGFYIADSSKKNSIVSCEINRRVGNSSSNEFVVVMRCYSLRLFQTSRTGRRLALRLGSPQFAAATDRSKANRIEISCSRITLDDYPFDWTCNPGAVSCSLVRIPLPTTVQDPIPTNETLPEPVVAAAGLDYWAYIVIVIGVVGIILFAGFSRNIIKACKTKRFYHVNRIIPRRRPVPSRVPK